MLAPGATPPVALAVRGRQVCSCFDVCDTEIDAALAACKGSADVQLAPLQAHLKCGTNCGSCVPELRRIVRLKQSAA